MKSTLHRHFAAALAAVTLILASGSLQTALAITRTVTNINDSGSGSLRAQVAAANTGDVIDFAPALNGKTIKLASQITITKAITITGPGWDRLTISGDGKWRIFFVATTDNVAGTSVLLQGLTLTKGAGKGTTGNGFDSSGGAIHSTSALQIRNCYISSSKTTPFGSDAGSGGGIFNTSTLFMYDTTVAYNEAKVGGGIANVSDLTVERCLIGNNKSKGNGGGIDDAGTMKLSNSTIAANHASENGGGVHSNGTNDYFNCTVSLNRAKKGGGLSGLAEGFGVSWALRNTIVANNSGSTAGPDIFTPPDFFGGYSTISLGHNLIGNTSGAGGFLTGTPVDDDILNPVGGARLGPLQDNNGPTLTMMLFPDSPAIDTGSNSFLFGGSSDQGPAITSDQRVVFDRVQLGATSLNVDVGAYEYTSPRTLKEKARDIVQACLATNPGEPTASLLTTALTEINLSLSVTYWVDDSHLNSPCADPEPVNSGSNVFDAEARAAAALVEVWIAGVACANEAQDALIALVNADELLARVAVKDARTEGRRTKYARREKRKALEALAKFKYVRAIEYFKEMWKEAVCGEPLPPGDTDDDDDDDH